MRIMVFEFDLYYFSGSDITKKVNEFCDEHNVIDIKVTRAKSDNINNHDSLFYTVIYKKE